VKRRDFVVGAAAAAALPAFLQRAFACPPPMPPAGCTEVPAGVDDVSLALHAAVVAGKPLLVILVPAEASRWDRGQLWGELLNHGPESVWAALACAEVVCATTAALRTVVPNAATDDDLFVLVETGQLPMSATSFRAAVPAYERGFGRGGGDAASAKKESQTGEARVAIMARLVEGAVLGNERSRLPQRASEAAAARAVRPAAGVDDNAAILLLRGSATEVVAAAQNRLQKKRVRGSKWATAGGCGVNVEGENDDVGYACGMGHTPALSRRFLYWFSKT